MNLKDEIMAGESYSLEFKRVPNEDRIKYLKTVVAFANGKGGRILFGVGKDRSIVGVPTDQVFQQMDAITDSIANGCAVFKGDDKAVFIDRREFSGALCDLIEMAHEYILSKINMGMTIVGAQRRDVYELPPDELRELVVNAFAHRNYFDHEAPIFVAVYDTRVEITSPGGLPRGLTVEKALAGCSKVRNKAIAEALSYMRYVEGWGSGLRRVSSSLLHMGLAPLDVVDDIVDVRVNVRRGPATDGLPIGDNSKPNDIRKLPIDVQKLPIGDDAVPIDAVLLKLKVPHATSRHIVHLFARFGNGTVFGRQHIVGVLQLKDRAAGNLIATMTRLGLIVPVSGQGKGRYRFEKQGNAKM